MKNLSLDEIMAIQLGMALFSHYVGVDRETFYGSAGWRVFPFYAGFGNPPLSWLLGYDPKNLVFHIEVEDRAEHRQYHEYKIDDINIIKRCFIMCVNNMRSEKNKKKIKGFVQKYSDNNFLGALEFAECSSELTLVDLDGGEISLLSP